MHLPVIKQIWDLEQMQLLSTHTIHSLGVNALLVWQGRYLLSASDDKSVKVIDMQSGKQLPIRFETSNCIKTMAVVDSMLFCGIETKAEHV